jgi:hypothetical protein
MRKTIRKPQNWQDFETLCKMLWGEMWGIQDKIKKNGRLGQLQSGVDIYGVPKGKQLYSGIQCKGKDDYSKSHLTKEEIDIEVGKAKNFTPALETFVFATTANKDVEIEKYIRQKDMESRLAGGFEILIFCWEDIADLIETHKDTFNYYMLENQFKSRHEFTIAFSNKSDRLVVKPRFKKFVTKFSYSPEDISINALKAHQLLMSHHFSGLQPHKHINCSWASFELTFTNTGSTVFEDYKLYISPQKGMFRNLSGFSGGIAGQLHYLKHSPLYVFSDEKPDERYAIYRPKDNQPLIQKDGRSFTLYILTQQKEYDLNINYQFLARDFNQEGNLVLEVRPEYEVEQHTIWVEQNEPIQEDEVKIEDIMKAGSLF